MSIWRYSFITWPLYLQVLMAKSNLDDVRDIDDRSRVWLHTCVGGPILITEGTILVSLKRQNFMAIMLWVCWIGECRRRRAMMLSVRTLLFITKRSLNPALVALNSFRAWLSAKALRFPSLTHMESKMFQAPHCCVCSIWVTRSLHLSWI
jgi:hypothetical protein